MALTNKNLLFIDEYFKNNMDGTKAYMVAYPNSSYESAMKASSRLLNNVEIRAEVNRRLTERHMSADEVLARLAEQAKGIAGDYINEQGKLDFKKLKKDGKGYLIQSIKPTKFGTEVQFPNSQTALINIGKQHGLFSDRKIIETKVEAELDSILSSLEEELSPDDFQRVVNRLTSGQTGSPKVATEDTTE